MQMASGPKRRAFRDNYLAAILGAAVFLLSAASGHAQIYTPSTNYGGANKRGSFDSTLFLPTGCGIPTDATWLFSEGFNHQGEKKLKFAIYGDSCGNKAYLWFPSLQAWQPIGAGAGIDTLYSRADSAFYLKDAIEHFAFLLGTGGSTDTTHLSARIDTKKDKVDSVGLSGYTTNGNRQKLADSLIAVFNSLFKLSTDSVRLSGYTTIANKNKLADSLIAVFNSLTGSYKLGTDSVRLSGYTTVANKNKLADSLTANFNALLALYKLKADSVAIGGYTTVAHTNKVADSLRAALNTLLGAKQDTGQDHHLLVNNLSNGYPLAFAHDSVIDIWSLAPGANTSFDTTTHGKIVINSSGGGGSSTTDTTLAGNGTGGSPLGVNQNIVNAAYWVLVHPYPSTNNTLFYGNSITYGYCPSCGSGTEVAYPTILQNGLGNTTVNNGAVSSTGVRTAYNYLSSTMPVAGAPTVGEAAFNNIRILMTGDTLHRFGHVKSAYRAIAALQFLNPATIQFYFTGSGAGSVNSNITTSLACGSCTAAIDTLKDFSSRAVFYRASVAGQSGTNWWLKNSITANETVTIANVRGAGIAIGTWADSVGWSRIQVAVDGSVVTTYNPNDRITMLNFDATFHRFGIQNDAIIIQGLQDTLHTVVLTFLDGTKIGGFDYVAGLKNPASCYVTPAYVYDIMHMGAAGYSYSLAPTTQAVQDSCNNSRWYDLFNNFGAYGYPVYQVHENYPVGHYNPGGDPTQIQTDGIHPTGLGQRNIAIDGLATMNYRQNYSATASAPSTPTLPVGPTGAVQFAGAAGFAGTSDVVIDSTNKGVTYGGYLEAQAINSSNAFFGYNAKVVSGSYTYINTAPASGLQFFVGGGLGFFANPSGTAAASFTRTFPFYANTSGQIQLGGNVSFTPSSFVDLPAATTSNSSLYMAPGSQPTSGLKVGLFYTTSAGHLFFHNGTAFQQLDAQVPGTATTNNLMFWTGTQVGGFGKWDATNNWLALGANAPTPFSDLSVNHNFAGFTEFRVSNSNAGGQSGFQAVNDQAGAIGIRAAGSTIGNVGPWLQGSGVLYNNINNDMGIMNNSAHDVYVATGSGTASDKFRIFSGGQIGLTTYTGTTFYKHLDSTNYKLLVQDAAGKLWSTDWPTFGSGSSAPFSDATAIAKNSSDPTKLFKFDLSSITTSNTRTMTVPDFDFTPATLGHAQTYTAANTFATASGSKLILSGNATTAPSTGHGAAIDGQAFSVTDQSAGSLLASYIMQPITYNSSSSNTYTAQPAGLYVAPPIAGSNTTFSVPAVAIWADGDILTKHTICNIGSTVSAGAGAGTAPSVSTAGSDIDGSITVITGTSPTVSAIVATITYGEHFPANSFATLTPANAVTAALNGATMVFTTGSTTNFTITSGSSALAASTTYKWYYHVGGN